MKTNSLLKQIFLNTSSQIFAKGLTVILGFLTVGLLTRYLGVNNYGIYTLVFAYLSFFGVFADFGLQLTLVRDLSVAKSPEAVKSTYFFIKLLLVGISTLLAVFALLFFPYDFTTKMAILVGSLAVGMGYMNGYGASVFQSKARLDTVAILEVVNRVATVIAIIALVLIHSHLYLIISAIFIGNSICFMLSMKLAPDFYRLKYLPRFGSVWKIAKAAFPIGITSLLAVLYFKIDTLMLSVIKNTTEVGIYSLSYKVFENILMLWLFYLASIYPLIAGYTKRHDKEKLFFLLKNSFAIALTFSVLFLCAGYLFSPLAIKVLAGDKFKESVLPLRILLFALPFATINTLLYYLLLSLSQTKIILKVLAVSIIFNFLFNLAIIPIYGYVGASWATVLTELIILIGYGTSMWKNKAWL